MVKVVIYYKYEKELMKILKTNINKNICFHSTNGSGFEGYFSSYSLPK
jgi:hypothetical protein